METTRQVSVFLENKPGRLAQVLLALAREKVNVVALTIYGRIDVTMLSMLARDREVGWYGAAANFAGLSLLLCAAGAARGIEMHVGHGLTYDTVKPVAAIPQVRELNIGHFIVGEALFVGLEAAAAARVFRGGTLTQRTISAAH